MLAQSYELFPLAFVDKSSSRDCKPVHVLADQENVLIGDIEAIYLCPWHVAACGGWACSVIPAASHQQSYIVMLFATLVETPQSLEHGCQRSLAGTLVILLQSVDEPLFAKFFVRIVAGFRHSVGEQRNRIAWAETAFADRAIPLAKKSEHGAGRL